MKTLVIINGVTGAIGTACLARVSREREVTIYGLSRKAEPLSTFQDTSGSLPDNTLICSIGEDIADKDNCEKFIKAIDTARYEKIIYIHSVGVYPFEIDAQGNIKVSHDHDGDGVDDRVVELSYNAFFAMTNTLRTTGLPLSALIFGGVADKYHPAVHKSWWTVMEQVKENMCRVVAEDEKARFFVLNISSVICPHEILTRPFVFQNTNADPRFWLMPHEVAEEAVMLTFWNSPKQEEGFVERNLFHSADYYQDDYFTDVKFTRRKKSELGIA